MNPIFATVNDQKKIAIELEKKVINEAGQISSYTYQSEISLSDVYSDVDNRSLNRITDMTSELSDKAQIYGFDKNETETIDNEKLSAYNFIMRKNEADALSVVYVKPEPVKLLKDIDFSFQNGTLTLTKQYISAYVWYAEDAETDCSAILSVETKYYVTDSKYNASEHQFVNYSDNTYSLRAILNSGVQPLPAILSARTVFTATSHANEH